MAINKVIFNGNTLIDLTNDTVNSTNLLVGASAHGRDGTVVNGACLFDADTSDATATAAEILAGTAQNPISAYVNGVKVIGAMPNNGGTDVEVNTLAGTTIPRGFSDGSAKAILTQAEITKFVPANIKQGVTLLGVLGDYSGEAISTMGLTVTPTASAQTFDPATYNKDYFSEVTVAGIPYVETSNTYGTTVTIG